MATPLNSSPCRPFNSAIECSQKTVVSVLAKTYIERPLNHISIPSSIQTPTALLSNPRNQVTATPATYTSTSSISSNQQHLQQPAASPAPSSISSNQQHLQYPSTKINNNMSHQHHPLTQHPTTLPFILQKYNGKLYLHHLALDSPSSSSTSPSPSPSATLRDVRRASRELKRKLHPPYGLLDRYPFLWKTVVETAVSSTQIITDIESQLPTTVPRQIFVSHRRPRPDLTAAFHDPSFVLVPPPTTPTTTNILPLLLLLHHGNKPNHNHTHPRILILVGLHLNTLAILAVLLLNILLCLGPGLLVGSLTRRVDLGVAVTSAAAAVLGCLEALLVVYHR